MRSLTMTEDEAVDIGNAAERMRMSGRLAVAREAERRLIAKLRAVPVERLAQWVEVAWDNHVGPDDDQARAFAETVRDVLIRAVEEDEWKP